jgi:hypothetical protein
LAAYKAIVLKKPKFAIEILIEDHFECTDRSDCRIKTFVESGT